MPNTRNAYYTDLWEWYKAERVYWSERRRAEFEAVPPTEDTDTDGEAPQ